ncbi:unnamed protein product [Amoebophrya sp. A120]|nr:unnamed protein product [Amoebophrya sp. A120]|eukprot:GSA120T00015083001.1
MEAPAASFAPESGTRSSPEEVQQPQEDRAAASSRSQCSGGWFSTTKSALHQIFLMDNLNVYSVLSLEAWCNAVKDGLWMRLMSVYVLVLFAGDPRNAGVVLMVSGLTRALSGVVTGTLLVPASSADVLLQAAGWLGILGLLANTFTFWTARAAICNPQTGVFSNLFSSIIFLAREDENVEEDLPRGPALTWIGDVGTRGQTLLHSPENAAKAVNAFDAGGAFLRSDVGETYHQAEEFRDDEKQRMLFLKVLAVNFIWGLFTGISNASGEVAWARSVVSEKRVDANLGRQMLNKATTACGPLLGILFVMSLQHNDKNQVQFASRSAADTTVEHAQTTPGYTPRGGAPRASESDMTFFDRSSALNILNAPPTTSGSDVRPLERSSTSTLDTRTKLRELRDAGWSLEMLNHVMLLGTLLTVVPVVTCFFFDQRFEMRQKILLREIRKLVFLDPEVVPVAAEGVSDGAYNLAPPPLGPPPTGNIKADERKNEGKREKMKMNQPYRRTSSAAGGVGVRVEGLGDEKVGSGFQHHHLDPAASARALSTSMGTSIMAKKLRPRPSGIQLGDFCHKVELYCDRLTKYSFVAARPGFVRLSYPIRPSSRYASLSVLKKTTLEETDLLLGKSYDATINLAPLFFDENGTSLLSNKQRSLMNHFYNLHTHQELLGNKEHAMGDERGPPPVGGRPGEHETAASNASRRTDDDDNKGSSGCADRWSTSSTSAAAEPEPELHKQQKLKLVLRIPEVDPLVKVVFKDSSQAPLRATLSNLKIFLDPVKSVDCQTSTIVCSLSPESDEAKILKRSLAASSDSLMSRIGEIVSLRSTFHTCYRLYKWCGHWRRSCDIKSSTSRADQDASSFPGSDARERSAASQTDAQPALEVANHSCTSREKFTTTKHDPRASSIDVTSIEAALFSPQSRDASKNSTDNFLRSASIPLLSEKKTRYERASAKPELRGGTQVEVSRTGKNDAAPASSFPGAQHLQKDCVGTSSLSQPLLKNIDINSPAGTTDHLGLSPIIAEAYRKHRKQISEEVGTRRERNRDRIFRDLQLEDEQEGRTFAPESARPPPEDKQVPLGPQHASAAEMMKKATKQEGANFDEKLVPPRPSTGIVKLDRNMRKQQLRVKMQPAPGEKGNVKKSFGSSAYRPNLYGARVILGCDLLNAVATGFSGKLIPLFLVQHYGFSPVDVLWVAFFSNVCAVWVAPYTKTVISWTRDRGYPGKAGVLLVWLLGAGLFSVLCLPLEDFLARETARWLTTIAIILRNAVNGSAKSYLRAKLVSYLPHDKLPNYMAWDTLNKAQQGGLVIFGSQLVFFGGYRFCFALTLIFLAFRWLVFYWFIASTHGRNWYRLDERSATSSEVQKVQVSSSSILGTFGGVGVPNPVTTGGSDDITSGIDRTLVEIVPSAEDTTAAPVGMNFIGQMNGESSAPRGPLHNTAAQLNDQSMHHVNHTSTLDDEERRFIVPSESRKAKGEDGHVDSTSTTIPFIAHDPDSFPRPAPTVDADALSLHMSQQPLLKIPLPLDDSPPLRSEGVSKLLAEWEFDDDEDAELIELQGYRTNHEEVLDNHDTGSFIAGRSTLTLHRPEESSASEEEDNAATTTHAETEDAVGFFGTSSSTGARGRSRNRFSRD